MCVCVCVCVCVCCTYCTGIGSRDVCYTKHSRIRVDNISPREIITILAGELLSEIHVIDIRRDTQHVLMAGDYILIFITVCNTLFESYR